MSRLIYHFTLVRNTVYRARVSNNVSRLLFKLSRFRKTYEYLEPCLTSLVSVREKARVAQVDATRAQVLYPAAHAGS